MTNLPAPIRPLLALAATALFALAVSACGTTTANVDNGRVLFIERCGTCHTLAEAGTTAEIGPNLDDAFAAARAAGEESETIEGVVKAQVEFPRPSNGDPVGLDAGGRGRGPGSRGRRRLRRQVGGRARRGAAQGPGRPRRPGLRQQRLRRLPHAGRRQIGRPGRPQPRRSPQRPELGDDRRIDRRPERQDRHRLPGKRDAAELRRNAQPRRTRRPGPVPDRRNGRRRRGPARQVRRRRGSKAKPAGSKSKGG